MLRKMAAMRAAKEHKRLERGHIESEPKMQRWHRFEFGVRDKISGETHFTDLKSVRHAAKALGFILKFYDGGNGTGSIPRAAASSLM